MLYASNGRYKKDNKLEYFFFNQVNLYSRNDYSFNARFSSVRDSLGKLKADCILDGEVVLLDSNSKANFDKIRNFWCTGKGYPVFYVFDILSY